ncbi:uncharacterized protein LOC144121047 isoform X3 [Amblyomma americanum]
MTLRIVQESRSIQSKDRRKNNAKTLSQGPLLRATSQEVRFSELFTVTPVASVKFWERAGNVQRASAMISALPATGEGCTTSTMSSCASTCPVEQRVRFQGIYCDTCEQCPIIGTRWKCALCVEYDLCTTCYLRGMHNLDHVFLRVEVPGGTADMVASRKGSGSLPVENVQFKATDVIFSGINCNGCDKRGIVGARWKCDQCIDYDLCTSCYVANAHSLDHVFWRFDSPGREGLRVSPRNELITTDGRAVLQKAVKFDGINCDRCHQRGIVGRRWKCAVCLDYDLCSACYMSDEHDQDHAFLRFDEPSAEGVRVLRREVSKNTHSRADSMAEKNACEDRRMKELERKPKDSTAGDHDARDELVTKLRELQDAVQCAICMEGQRNVAFLCGHRSCADCAEHLSVCHMCRLPITMKITLY